MTVLVAPIIPAINEHEIEAILKARHRAGAREAGYVLLRLPHELKDLMRDWLVEHYPDKLRHVFSLAPGDARRQGLRRRAGASGRPASGLSPG